MKKILTYAFGLFIFNLIANEPQITELRNIDQLTKHIQKSIELAESHTCKLPPEIFALEGMSSAKGRALLNNLCSLPGTSYLEIGVWAGSTFISALYDNKDSILQATAIDDWSEFEGPEKKFHANCSQFIDNIDYGFISDDCFAIDPNNITSIPINLYFYDGAHDALSQELALTHYAPCLNDQFILVVDDWNYPPAREGTYAALKKLNYDVLYSAELPSQHNGDTVNWWNGMYVALISKQKEL